MHITEMGKIATKKTIIKLYFQTNHGIRTIAAMMNMKKSDIGKIIQRHKKKHNIR